MAAIVWADVVGWAPELSTVSATVQADVVTYVNTHFDVTKFPDGEVSTRLRIARILLAAHLASTPKLGSSGAAGPVISRSGGGLSETYASMSSSAGMQLTTYGQQLKTILRPIFGGPYHWF